MEVHDEAQFNLAGPLEITQIYNSCNKCRIAAGKVALWSWICNEFKYCIIITVKVLFHSTKKAVHQ